MAKKTEAEKNVERQNLKNVYEPNIRAMKSQRDSLVSEIEHLKMQKIFLDSNIQTMDSQYLELKKVVDFASSKYSNYDDLEGKYMKHVRSETDSITAHGDTCLTKMNHAGMVATAAQEKLNKKIETLQSDLTNLIREISDAQIQFQIALNSII
ncbi:hypothetical protein BCR22_10610 [Enterococcus plantarum]|uniref:hypothetical protein n=1 Tax=Enterococcus TaxID=1350 RepID=UPI00084D0880|nr:hypothetical protein [Enterococcus plantarum]OEG18786.1 hypothetical protein BCR22_10610 [Enterococcus plantarum]